MPITCRIGRHAVLQRLAQWRCRDVIGRGQLLEGRGVGQPQPDVQADEPEGSGDQERDAPAVGIHGRIAEQRLQQRDGHRPQQEADHTGPRDERDGHPASRVGCELGEIACAAAVFAACRKTLQAAEKQQQQRGGDTDRVVGRQEAHRQCRTRHQQDHDGEHLLAADPVAERTEDESAEWSHHECGGEDREGVQQCGRVVACREEVRGDEGGEEAVDGEVVPLDGVADRRTADDLAKGGCAAHPHHVKSID